MNIILPPMPYPFDAQKVLFDEDQLNAFGTAAIELYIASRVPPDDAEIEDMAHSACQEALTYGLSVDSFMRPLKTLAKNFREVDRTSRVPMTDDQVTLLVNAWWESCEHVSSIARATEEHHDIGVSP